MEQQVDHLLPQKATKLEEGQEKCKFQNLEKNRLEMYIIWQLKYQYKGLLAIDIYIQLFLRI